MHRATTPTALVVSLLVALSGCTDDGDDGGDSSGGSGDAGGSWQDTKACELLPEQEVTELLGKDHPDAKPSDEFDRPTCEWKDPASLSELKIMLWDPPVDGVADDPDTKTVPVGDHTGTIETSTDRSCSINVKTDTATLTVELGLPSENLGDDDPCEIAASTGETVLDELGW